MDLFHAFILGIVEGLTEFLPVSSTAHLIITSNVFGLTQTDFVKFFEVFIQAGAIAAAILLYLKYVLRNRDIIMKVFFSFIPTAAIGFILYKTIKTLFFESNDLIINAMFLLGVGFIIIEYLIDAKKIVLRHTLEKISPPHAIFIGVAQALAVIPGVSRSGIVMMSMMSMGYRRDEAALYSFLLAVPTICAASLYDLYKMRDVVLSSGQYFPLMAAGFITSFMVAYIVMKWFVGFLQKNSLYLFGAYRIILAIILLFVY